MCIRDRHEIASAEYAVKYLKVKSLIIMGHQNCGAVTAATQDSSLTPHLDQLVEKIHTEDGHSLDENIVANAKYQANTILKESQSIRQAYEQNELIISYAYYSIKTNEVTFHNL